MELIGDKSRWWLYLQGGIRGIKDGDYDRIVQHAVGATELASANAPNLEVAGEDQTFALEKHLEDFIDSNWARIKWGRTLALYKSEAGTGRQFPAGKWSIDFLATDDEKDAFVVVELKRGSSSDDAVGQTLRYIGWVRENLARPGQKVEGIIVCSAIDDALKYAVRELENVSVMTYQVSFSLTEPEL